jgi:hypothetical protein
MCSLIYSLLLVWVCFQGPFNSCWLLLPSISCTQLQCFTMYSMMVSKLPMHLCLLKKANDHLPIRLCGRCFGRFGALTCRQFFSLIPQNLIHPGLSKDHHLSLLYHLEVDHVRVLAMSLRKPKSWFSCTTWSSIMSGHLFTQMRKSPTIPCLSSKRGSHLKFIRKLSI